MKNKRVTIYIKPEDWKKVRVESVKAGVSLGDYLMGYWRESQGKSVPVERVSAESKIEKVVEREEIADWRSRIKAIPKK